MEKAAVDQSDVQLKEIASEQYTGDKETLIENGLSPTERTQSNGQAAHASEPLKQSSSAHQLAHEKKKTARGLQVIIVSSVVFAVSLTIALIVTIYCAPPQVPPHGAVSCDDERASQIGVDIMQKEGGSAIDAAVATLFALSVVQPESSGIGGGGYLVLREHAQKRTTSIAFREKAPENIVPADVETAFRDVSDVSKHGAYVGVPGALQGYWTAHKKFGKVSWKRLLEPSIKLARDGYKVSYTSAKKMQHNVNCTIDLQLAKHFCDENGRVFQEGDTIKRPEYAKLLEKVAEDGPKAFYEGKVAEDVLQKVNAANGVMTMEDLQNYDVLVGGTISTSYQGMTLESVGIGAAGGVFTLMMLNIVEHYHAKTMSQTDLYHYLVEAQKVSSAIGGTLGDPEFNKTVSHLIDYYISKDFAKKAFEAMSYNETFTADYYNSELDVGVAPEVVARNHHTTHVSVVGPNEDHVAVTSSLNFNFGSRIMTESGVILNNALDDFNLQPVNFPAGGKRPQSHISPLVAHSKDRPCGLRLAAGAAGGSFIPADVAYVLANLLQLRLELDDAVSDGRVLVTPYSTMYQPQTEADIVTGLEQKGHVLTAFSEEERFDAGVCNVAMKVNETVSAKADPTRAATGANTGEVVF